LAKFKEKEMRHTIRNWVVFSILLLGITAPVCSEPILGGRFLDHPPTSLSDKPLFLAHIFNSGNTDIKSGEYQVGIEMNGQKGKKVFLIKPRDDIQTGQIKTFRIAVIPGKQEKKGIFRVFLKTSNFTEFSEYYNYSNEKVSSGEIQNFTLYTEAPPEPAVLPPPEIPFENEKIAAAPKPASQQLPDNRLSGGEQKAVKADPSEFKTLNTIDEELVIYVVKKGDSLKSIAEKYYGKPSKDKTIADLNFMEVSANLKPGEEIIVDVLPLKKSGKNLDALINQAEHEKPKVNQKEKQTSKIKEKNLSAVSEPTSVKKPQEYVIKSGDTLAKISKKFFGKASQAEKILKANPGLNKKNLKVGTTIIVPAG